jgi:outer membrane protein assembly factor BamA
VLTSDIAGGILGGDNDFYTLTGTFQRYHPLSPGLVVAWRVRGGYGNAYGQSDVVPVEKRYFLGGGNSVRGYQESSLGPRASDASGADLAVGGQVILLANLELRHPIPLLARWNFSGAVFFDSGNVWENPSAISLKDFRFYTRRDETTLEDYRYSVGLGIRYNTPIGPIRLDYGYAIKQDERTDSNGRFYLSLGQIF